MCRGLGSQGLQPLRRIGKMYLDNFGKWNDSASRQPSKTFATPPKQGLFHPLRMA